MNTSSIGRSVGTSTVFPAKQETFVTVLAIYDKPSSSSLESPSQRAIKTVTNVHNKRGTETSPTVISIVPMVDDDNKEIPLVHVNNITQTPPSTSHINLDEQLLPANHPEGELLSNGDNKTLSKNNFTPAKITPDKDASIISTEEKRSVRSVSLEFSTERDGFNKFVRNDARKSRISEAFLDAKDRIDQELEDIERYSEGFGKATHRLHKIVIGLDSVDLQLGLEVSAIPDPERPNRLLSLEVIRIEENGRVAQDGRIRIGDQIVEINGVPCREISFARAKLRLRDLANVPEPTIIFQRRIQPNTPSSNKTENLTPKPVITPLQQGNTSQISRTLVVSIEKSSNGFGFSFAGRLNAQGEHMYYVKSLKDGGPSVGILSVADRLLKINGVDLSEMQQTEITALLKSVEVGDRITLLISRVDDGTKTHNEQDDKGESINVSSIEKALHEQLDPTLELLKFEIQSNDSPSAGMGISLKAQRKFIGGVSTDSGLYVKSILHGSAAYKDGRLRIDDRLVGIESLNLLQFGLNGEALDAFMRCISSLPSTSTSVCIYVARRKSLNNINKGDDRNIVNNLHKEEGTTLKRFCSDSELSQISASTIDPKAFIRNAPIRRSISEKHPFGTHTDPSHLKTYQRILHRRQTSAPPLKMRNGKINRRSFGNNQNNVEKSYPNKAIVPQMSAETPTGRLSGAVLRLSNNYKSTNCNNRKLVRPITIYGESPIVNNDGDKITEKTNGEPTQPSESPLQNVVTGFSPKMLRKFGPSSFKGKRSKLMEFFNGITGSGRSSYKEPHSTDSSQEHKCSENSMKSNDKENHANIEMTNGIHQEQPLISSPMHQKRSKSAGVSSILAEEAARRELEFHPPDPTIQNSYSHPDFVGQQHFDDLHNVDPHFPHHHPNLIPRHLILPTEKRKSFGNGILRFLKGGGSSSASKEQHQKWRRSEFYMPSEHQGGYWRGWMGGPQLHPYDQQQQQMFYSQYHGQPPPYYFYAEQPFEHPPIPAPPYAYNPQQQMYFHQRGYSEYNGVRGPQNFYYTTYDCTDTPRKFSDSTKILVPQMQNDLMGSNTMPSSHHHTFGAPSSTKRTEKRDRSKVRHISYDQRQSNEDPQGAVHITGVLDARCIRNKPRHVVPQTFAVSRPTDDNNNSFIAHQGAAERYHEQPQQKVSNNFSGQARIARPTTIMNASTSGLRMAAMPPEEATSTRPKQPPPRTISLDGEWPIRNLNNPQWVRQSEERNSFPIPSRTLVGQRNTPTSSHRQPVVKMMPPPPKSSSDSNSPSSDDTAAYYPPNECPEFRNPPPLTAAQQKQRQKLLKRSIPSAVFYDDSEPPVRC